MYDVQITDLTFRYDNTTEYIIKDFSANINKGQNILVYGDNGTGKTTFGKLVCGLMAPTAGSIKYNTMRINRVTARKRIKLAYYIYQINHLQFIKPTLEGEILFTSKFSKTSGDMNYYDRFFLPPDLNINPYDLSINQAWRFTLFLTTIIEPHLIFIDEIPSLSNRRNLSALKYLLYLRKGMDLVSFYGLQRQINIDSEVAFEFKLSGEINERFLA